VPPVPPAADLRHFGEAEVGGDPQQRVVDDRLDRQAAQGAPGPLDCQHDEVAAAALGQWEPLVQEGEEEPRVWIRDTVTLVLLPGLRRQWHVHRDDVLGLQAVQRVGERSARDLPPVVGEFVLDGAPRKSRELTRSMIAKTFPFTKTFHAYTPKTLRAVKSLRDHRPFPYRSSQLL
jgi:hypothetical protein